MTTFVLNSLRQLTHARWHTGLFAGLLKYLGLLLSLLVACPVWLGHQVRAVLMPPLATRVWIKRRVRVLNRMHATRALGFVITLIGLVMVWLAILFKVLMDPVPYVEPPQAIESKDDALRLTLEAQAQHPALDKPMPSVDELVKSYSRRLGTRLYGTRQTGMQQTPAQRSAARLNKSSGLSQRAGLNRTPIRLQEQPVVPVQVHAADTQEAPAAAQVLSLPPVKAMPVMAVAQAAPSEHAVQERCSDTFFLFRASCEIRECQKREYSDVLFCRRLKERQ